MQHGLGGLRGLRVLVIDNFDSFTFNLVQALASLTGRPVRVLRNDAPWREVASARHDSDAIVVSPGPGHPATSRDFGVCERVLREARKGRGRGASVPVLGVCLGHQGMATVAGGRVRRAAAPMHGRSCRIFHGGEGLFQHIPQGFQAVRYNSLLVDEPSLPPNVRVTAWAGCKKRAKRAKSLAFDAQPREVMGLCYPGKLVFGVQFHPESVGTEHGRTLLKNFLGIVARTRSVPLRASLPLPALASSLKGSERTTSTRSKSSGFRRVVRRLGRFVDPEATFQALYASQATAFWLDSSLEQKHRGQSGGGRSRCCGQYGTDDREQSARWSFMGDARGPHALVMSYDARTRRARVWRGHDGQSFDDALSKAGQSVLNGRVSLFAALEWLLSLRKPSVNSVAPKSIMRGGKNWPSDALPGFAPPNPLPFPFDGGIVGYIGYEAKSETLPRRGTDNETLPSRELPKRAPEPPPSSADPPDSTFLLADRIIVFDHKESDCYLVCLARNEIAEHKLGDAPPVHHTWLRQTSKKLMALPSAMRSSARRGPASRTAQNKQSVSLRMEHDRAAYLRHVKRCKRFIASGESYELCLTNQCHVVLKHQSISGSSRGDDAKCELLRVRDPLSLYTHLRRTNPAPHAAYLRFGKRSNNNGMTEWDRGRRSAVPGFAVLCSSPERFLRADRQGHVAAAPIKGTRPRGRDPVTDAALKADLRLSEKDRAENLMIVDLTRNDLGRICEVGSIKVPQLMRIRSYATVHQMESVITGHLLPGATPIHAAHAAFPPGSMTGAPKLRSTRILAEIERGRRGPYAGVLGYFAHGGAADLAVVIRSFVWREEEGGVLTVGTGGAVVHLSDPVEEFDEMVLKTSALVNAAQAYFEQHGQAKRES